MSVTEERSVEEKNEDLRTLVSVAQETDDECKRQLFGVMMREGDCTVTMDQAAADTTYSLRTLRRHSKESEHVERSASHGVVLIQPVDEASRRAINVVSACLDNLDKYSYEESEEGGKDV